MKKSLLYFTKYLIVVLFVPHFVFAQGQKPYGEFSIENKKAQKKLLKSARKYSDFGNFPEAITKYEELLKIDSTNPMFNLELAQMYYDNFLQPKSIPYYERAIRNSKDTLGEAYLYLANAYHLTNNFELAKKYYKQYVSLVDEHGTGLTGEEQ